MTVVCSVTEVERGFYAVSAEATHVPLSDHDESMLDQLKAFGAATASTPLSLACVSVNQPARSCDVPRPRVNV